ncbi:hypothetical protein BN14_08392 [Rhizoctonia solani AG-1 IB]|nr:hypothetical protein BN14_08392 [Rhizoctonia solani AG-1 IB]
MGIKGYVPVSGRGYARGKASGVPSNFASLVVVAWSNSAAQYWARAEASTGNYYSPAMKPGTYTMTMYKSELAVATATVTISAGQTITANIKSAEATPSVIWQLGEFDGTPRGFLNADMIETMHPSDKRMHEWPRTITIGQQGEGYFPMAIFKAIGPAVIRFSVSSSQTGARTLQIGITLAFAGTWRGNNVMYTINIPAGVLVSNERNVLTINVISGSGGDAYLSPNVVVDAIRLY